MLLPSRLPFSSPNHFVQEQAAPSGAHLGEVADVNPSLLPIAELNAQYSWGPLLRNPIDLPLEGRSLGCMGESFPCRKLWN